MTYNEYHDIIGKLLREKRKNTGEIVQCGVDFMGRAKLQICSAIDEIASPITASIVEAVLLEIAAEMHDIRSEEFDELNEVIVNCYKAFKEMEE